MFETLLIRKEALYIDFRQLKWYTKYLGICLQNARDYDNSHRKKRHLQDLYFDRDQVLIVAAGLEDNQNPRPLQCCCLITE